MGHGVLMNGSSILNREGNVPNAITMLDQMAVELGIGVVGVRRAEDEGGALVVSHYVLGDLSMPVL